MTDVVTLIRVDSLTEESRVLASLAGLTAVGGVSVAPVLDRDGLPERLMRALHDAGCDVRWLDLAVFERAPAAANASAAGAADPPRRPASVIVTEGVPRELTELAACLAGVRPRPLSNRARPREVIPSTALLLVNPDTVAVSDVTSAFSALIGSGAHVGIIYVLDPIDSRFAILKCLLPGKLTGRGMFTVFSSRGDLADGAAPARLRATSGDSAPGTVAPRQDLLVVSGHSNPLDAELGSEAALCTRSGPEESWASLTGVYPCFADGQCFRQPSMGRSPADRSGLINLQTLEATVVTLSGCNAAALGGAWFNPRVGLAYQCQQSSAIASIVSAGVSLERLELDLLLVALIAEGLPLGEVVTEVNRVRAEVHGETSAYPAPAGPLILFGNPRLEMDGLELQCPTASNKPDGTTTVDLAAVRFDAERSAILRVDIPLPATPPFIFLRAAPDGTWCRGVWYPVGAGARLYLWLGHRGGGPCEGRLALAYSFDDPTARVKAAIRHCLLQVPFWLLALRQYRSNFEDAGPSRQCFDTGLAALSEAVYNFTVALAVLCPDRGILIDERRMWAIAGDLWQALGALSRLLVDCLVEVACQLGTLRTSSWEGNLERRDSVGPLARCLCANAVWSQRYSYPADSRLERTEYQCPACGPVGEDDGRRLLRLTGLPRTIEQGSVLTASLECRALDEEITYVAAIAVIESPFKDRRMIGDLITGVAHPGQVSALEVSVSVPSALTPGLYAFAALAVVNGASCVSRHMVEVRRSLAT